MSKGIAYITDGGYMNEDKSCQRAFKIGHSSTVHTIKVMCAFMGRMCHNKTYHPNSEMIAVVLFASKADAKEFESLIHDVLTDSRLKGEWFANTSQVQAIITDMVKIQHDQVKKGEFTNRLVKWINKRNNKAHKKVK